MTSQPENLQGLITRARYVLFDFDGPICRVFAGHSADGVAAGLVEWLEDRGEDRLLTAEERRTADPWDVLRAVGRRRPGSDLLAEVEERLTLEEICAVTSATPTVHADPLIRTWRARGAQLAIATNNSPRAVRKYLEGHGLDGCFPHVFGRTPDPRLLKPHPHCLEQALTAFGADPVQALMLGDSPPDVEAARRAGVAFLGYARNDRKEKELREAGAENIVYSLREVTKLLSN
ncbi:HAD family hydrolase [Streptomyces sp. 351MFTsu5.1]|uniref:HAD family hydrolase n=1 Tax=Streptomyces sp. 351MFTsu5.1 TaxID=1172180 RepID=UPI0003A11064|nr:HAD family hydrolase [Streptomyces sp. 351MFTsu5.1]